MSKYLDDDDRKLAADEYEDDDVAGDDEEDDLPKTKSRRNNVGNDDDDAGLDDDDDDDAGLDDDEDEDEVDDDDDDVLEEPTGNPTAAASTGMNFMFNMNESDGENEDDDEDDEKYLQKFEENLKHNIIEDYHPEMQKHNYDEIEVLTRIVRDQYGNIVDPLHQSIPFVTKYEKTRILGERARQLNAGATPFVEVEPEVIDGYVIALKEFQEKKIPFILKRPISGNHVEYWKLSDLEII